MNNSISKKEKEYIQYNLKRFFEHYKLEDNIIKISGDIITLQKMKEDTVNLLNFLPQKIKGKLINDNDKHHNKTSKSEDTAFNHFSNLKNKENKKKQIVKKRDLTNDKNRNLMKKLIKTPENLPKKITTYQTNYVKKQNFKENKPKDLSQIKNKKSNEKYKVNNNKNNNRGITPVKNKTYMQIVKDNIKSNNNELKKTNVKRPLTPDIKIKKIVKNNDNKIIKNKAYGNKDLNKNLNNISRVKSKSKSNEKKIIKKNIPLNQNRNKNLNLSKDKQNNNIKIKQNKNIIVIKKNKNENNIKKEITNIKKDYYIIPNINFSQKNIIPLYYTIHLGFFEIEKKIKLILNQNELYKHYSSQNLFKEYYLHIEKEFTEISQLLLKYDMNKICIPFSPNKTAKNGLMFISKEDEKNLIENEQPEEIIIIFKVVLLLLEEDISKIENNKILQYLFIDIFQKYKVENIQNLFLNHIINKVHLLGKKYINDINVIIGNKPELLTPAEVLKYNRNVSYMTFIIKDIYNFLLEKTDDGIFFYELREFNKQLIVLNKKLERLKSFYK